MQLAVFFSSIFLSFYPPHAAVAGSLFSNLQGPVLSAFSLSLLSFLLLILSSSSIQVLVGLGLNAKLVEH
jgi:hypothetical protein